MTNIDSSLYSQIIELIDQIEIEYRENQGLILTEDDLKCLIYLRLSQLDNLNKYEETLDKGIKANSVHAELSWYNSEKKLAIKPDITILDPKNLSILKGIGSNIKLPSKQFNFSGSAIIFEIKFIRIQSGITEYQFKKEILKDFEKIKKLFEKLESEGYAGKVYCFFVVFSKTPQQCQQFKGFISSEEESGKYKFIIKNGNVKFSKKPKRANKQIQRTADSRR